jgi:predicted DNA-binding protein
MTTQFIIRLPDEIKQRFGRVAKTEGKSASQVVRELMETYLAERDVAAHVNSLWSRIGGVMRRAGHSERDVARTVAAVRRARA